MAHQGPFVRPDWVRRLNLFGDSVGGAVNLVSLDPDELIDVARSTTGLDDFGDNAWEPAYRTLLAGIEAHADLNVVGRLSTRAEILRCLQLRLRLNRHWSEVPAIRQQPIVAPVFILGPPRTGTTILLELFALDPSLRPVIAHEAHHPLGTLDGVETSAVEASEPEQEFWADIQPEFMTMHELRSDLPCECVHFSAPVFDSWHWPMMHDLGDGEPLADMTATYGFHNAFLQTLQHADGSPQTFLLKSPAHLGSLTALLETYPDARMVHTHRDPLKFVGSSASITTTLHWLRSDSVTPAERGPLMSLAYQLMLALAMGQRDSGEVPADQMTDLHFRDLMGDPVGTVERAYRDLGMVFPDEMRESIPEYLASKPKDKFGKHLYDAAGLGLDESQVRDDFADYISRYDIELE